MKIIKSKIGDLFCMTIGEWNNDYTYYRIRGNAYIPINEIAGLQRNIINDGEKAICRVKLKTGIGLGLNGVSTLWEIPMKEWDELVAYLTEGEDK